MGREFSKHQRRIIRNFYENRDTLALQKLGEVVSEIYLTDPGMKRKRLWDRAIAHLQALDVKEETWAPIVEDDNPSRLAKLLTELQGHE